MDHVTSAICYKALVDQQTNLLTLVDLSDVAIFEETKEAIEQKLSEGGGQFIFGPVHYSLVSLWYRTNTDVPESGYFRITLIAPDGKKVLIADAQEISLENDISARTIAVMKAFPFRGLGRYTFAIHKRENTNGRWTLCTKLPLIIRCRDPINP